MEKIISDLKAELEYSNAMFEKEKNILLKTINELKMKTNNQTKKAPILPIAMFDAKNNMKQTNANSSTRGGGAAQRCPSPQQ